MEKLIELLSEAFEVAKTLKYEHRYGTKQHIVEIAEIDFVPNAKVQILIDSECFDDIAKGKYVEVTSRKDSDFTLEKAFYEKGVKVFCVDNRKDGNNEE